MNDTLRPGLEHQMSFRVPASKTVPTLYPESPEFQAMPAVLATGFLVGLLEWACIQAINPHLDWPREQTVGTHVDVSHAAPTPPGLDVTVRVRLTAVDGRQLTFDVEAHDGLDLISRGTHRRAIIDAERFAKRARHKAARHDADQPAPR